MSLLSLLTLGLFGKKTNRNINNIVATFTKVRSELEIAIEEQQADIDKAKIAKLKADEAAEKAVEEATAKANEAIRLAKEHADILINDAKKLAKKTQDKALSKQAKVLKDGIETIKSAKESINVANQWIDKIPSID